MMRTKKDVDKHVRTLLSKLREDEKNLRGYRIAGLYYKINEYSSALEYIQRYIQANDKNPAAYKVLGQCYEKLKRPDKQLLAYQRSLELDKKQTDLLIEVCKLLQNNELSDVTPAKAKYWYDLAESRNIHDSAILNLKLKFMNQSGIQDIILKEIVRRPLDIGLRTRLVYQFLDQNRVDDAFKYVSDIEMKPNFKFKNSKDWYKTVLYVVDKYKEENSATINNNWPYWLQLITTNERQVFLTLAHTPKDSNAIDHNLLEAANLLFELDQNLNKVATSCSFLDSERNLASEFLSHFCGQLSLHAASLLFKREAEQSIRGNWHETTKSALPLLLLAFNAGAIDGNQLWLRNSSETTKQLIDTWQSQSSFRSSQAARTLLSCVTSNDSSDYEIFQKICTDKYNVWSTQEDVLNEIRSIVADSDWRKKLHRTLFVSKEQLSAGSSYMVESRAFETPTFNWPDINSLIPIEVKSQEADPSSLGHLVYLALGNKIPTDSQQTSITIDQEFKCVLFPKLNYSTNNLMHCNAETLNQLDIDSFLYATTLQTKRNIGTENALHFSSTPVQDSNKPKILPYVNMVNALATEEQNEWWTAAYKIYHNIAGGELTELRATLQYGIEAIRGVCTPKMDLIILLKLGQIFSKKAQRTTKSVERGFFEERSEALFKFALYMVRMQNISRTQSEPFRRLFKYTVGNNFFEIEQEVNTLAEEAIIFLAGRYFKKNAFEECIDNLAGIKLPFATYFQSESYRKLTEISDTPKKNKRVYLDKARDYLKQTLDLLDGPNVDKNHPLKSIVDEDIKRLHNETRKLETTQSTSDSFDSVNGRSNFEESAHRYDREIELPTPTPVQQIGYDNLKQMMRQMMESLNISKEYMTDLRNRVQNIEEQMNKKDDIDINDPDDYYLNEEARNQSHNLNNTLMMANLSRNQTINQYTPKPSQLPPSNIQLNARGTPNAVFPHQSQIGLSNMIPLLNNMYGPLSMNPYQSVLINLTRQSYGQLANNFQCTPILPYGIDIYNLQQQHLAQLPQNDPLLSLLQQQPNVMQLPLGQQSYALTNPLISSAITTNPPVAVPKVQISVAQSTVNVTPSSIKMQWNTPIKNTPVEKGPQVNVVITSSDSLPQTITTISTEDKKKPRKLKKTKPTKEDDYELTAYFEPVIPLPDLVEVKTGEENEEVLFKQRGKLFHFIKESKEWKECGVGNMKVIINKYDPKKVRLLMRREQVFKLCCNQFLEKETKFNKMPNTETALAWIGHDFSESKLQVKIMAIRFETADLRKRFHNAILSAQAKMTTKFNEKYTSKEVALNKTQMEAKGFGDQFMPRPESCLRIATNEDKSPLSFATSIPENDQIMESLNILKDDVAEVCRRVQNIEDLMNDFFSDEEACNQSRNLFPLGNVQMNARRTPSTAIAHQSLIGLNTSYNSSVSQMLHNIYGPIAVELCWYLLNAATQSYGQFHNNFEQTPMFSCNQNDSYIIYNLQNVMQQSLLPRSRALPKPLVSSAITTIVPAGVPKVMPTSVQKRWNTPIKNTPVEKRLPVNVVITSSDQLPQNITTISTQQAASSLNIMKAPYHIKNYAATQTFGAALAYPTIAEELKQKFVDRTMPQPKRSDTPGSIGKEPKNNIVPSESTVDSSYAGASKSSDEKKVLRGRSLVLQLACEANQNSQSIHQHYCIKCDRSNHTDAPEKEEENIRSNVDDQVKWLANLCDLSENEDGSSPFLSSTQFTDIPNLKKEVLSGISALNIKFATQIQEILLPMLLLNPTKDFIIEPKPGSGISTALAIYALNKIRPEIEFTQVLWVSVNNESAIQAHKLLQALAQDLKANIQITISLEGSFVQPRGGHIVVGTPKDLPSCRILGFYDLKRIELAVIDDADMIATSHNFVDHVLIQLPHKCQKIASSPVYNQNCLSNFNGEKLWLKTELTHIKQYFVNCSDSYQKCRHIAEYLRDLKFSAIIYCNEKVTAEFVADIVQRHHGIEVTVSIGSMEKKDRIQAFQKFANGSSNILVTTNMLSRGIDVPDVRLVMNFDVPNHSKEFLFRATRCGRLGRESAMITFIDGLNDFPKIEEYAWKNHLLTPQELKFDLDV